jgi:hypothetical protein
MKGSVVRVWPVPAGAGVIEGFGYAVDEDSEMARSTDWFKYLPPVLVLPFLMRAEARARWRRPTHPGNLGMAQLLTKEWYDACAEVGRSNKE